jgi:serine O-acetyltransferase
MDQSTPPANDPGAGLNLGTIVAELRAVRAHWRQSQNRPVELGGRELPSPEALAKIIAEMRAALFPMRLGPPDLRQETEDFFVGHVLDSALHALLAQARLELRQAARLSGQRADETEIESRALSIVREFAARLPQIRALLDIDVLAAYQGDPAARSVDEVLLCYPGVLALIHHRIAHELYRLGAPLLARLVAEIAHSKTGVDIHPGARIGAGCFIDHGTGVVIGETAEIGERVRIYQTVTLGAKSFPADETGRLHKGLPRHPIVEDDVVIYAGATILGRIRIGRGSTIGGNVWLTRSVPPESQVSQASTRNEAVEGGAGI